MREIDLIPASYRDKLWMIAFFKRYVVAVVGALLLICMISETLGYYIQQTSADIRRLQTSKEVSDRQQLRLEALDKEKNELWRQLKLLEGLRGGASAENIIRVLDTTLNAKVWFLDWEFNRDGVVVNEGTVETGYFIVRPLDGSEEKSQTWKIQTHMNIRGQVTDYEALSMFVKRLFAEPLIKDVRVTRTSSRQIGIAELVEFSMVIIVNNNSAANRYSERRRNE